MNIATRLVEEYRRFKEAHAEEILLYQVGTFYKIMHEDAESDRNAFPIGAPTRFCEECSMQVNCSV